MSRQDEIERHRAEYRAKELAFIADPMEWPRWPLLPMKRSTATEPRCQLGFMTAMDTKKVFLKPMYELQSGRLGDVIDGVPFEEYPNVEALVDAGWEVD